MINDVRNAWRGLVGSVTHLKHSAGPGRVFELYVMTGITLALKAQGYEVFVRRSDGSRVRATDPDRRFVQRGRAPARIGAAAGSATNASSIVFRRGDRPAWRMLNGVLFQGPQRRLPRNRCRSCARYRRHHPPQLCGRQSAWTILACRSNARTSARTEASTRCARSSHAPTILLLGLLYLSAREPSDAQCSGPANGIRTGRCRPFRIPRRRTPRRRHSAKPLGTTDGRRRRSRPA